MRKGGKDDRRKGGKEESRKGGKSKGKSERVREKRKE